jgi:hypothetical protein
MRMKMMIELQINILKEIQLIKILVKEAKEVEVVKIVPKGKELT